MSQEFVPAGRSKIGMELLMRSNSQTKTGTQNADVILMCKAMKTTDFQIKMDNTNSKTPDKPPRILRYSFLAREWE
jgi:hypothetical protein